MRRLLALTAVGVTLAAVGAGTATPYSGGPDSPVTDPVHKEQVKAWLRATGYTPVSNDANVHTGMYRARVAAGILPRVATAANPIILGATGIAIAYKVGTEIGGSDFLYTAITGSETYSAGAGTYLPPQISYASDCDSGYTAYALPASGDCYMLQGTGNAAEIQSWGGGGFWTPNSSDAPILAAHAAANGWTRHADRTNACTTHTTGSCAHVFWKTQAEMSRTFTAAPMTAGEYAASGSYKPTVTTMPSTTSDGDLTAALTELGALDSDTGDAVQEQTLDDLNDQLEPGWAETFTLPKPNINETYAAYITRLEGLGWLGTATSTVLATENPAYGPEAVTRVTVVTSTGTRTLAPLTWPTSAVQIEPDTDITLRYNPDTAPEAPTEGGSGTEVVLPPTTIPEAPGIDFGPITELDGACSFPFGFLCYAAEVTGWFDVAPDAPVFDLDVTIPALAGGGTIAYTVDLNVMDAYMSLLRGIISVVLWIGGVYFLAVNLLGFRAGGDPGEAVDEALHV